LPVVKVNIPVKRHDLSTGWKKQTALSIDCVEAGAEPGAILRVPAEELIKLKIGALKRLK
jgi:Ni,Fe-hydrogenase maturation factor